MAKGLTAFLAIGWFGGLRQTTAQGEICLKQTQGLDSNMQYPHQKRLLGQKQPLIIAKPSYDLHCHNLYLFGSK